MCTLPILRGTLTTCATLLTVLLSFTAESAAQTSPQPLRFEANQGQSDSRVHFLSRGPGYTLFLTGTGATLDLHQTKDRAAALRMTLRGGNTSPAIVGEERSLAHTSYFLGQDPSQWHADVPSYNKVRYGSVYPGVDLVFYGNDGQLEYDFVVAPDADPGRIALAFEGAEKLEVDAEGTLMVRMPGGEALSFHKPVVYQPLGSTRRPVAGAFAVTGRTAKFTLGDYDSSKPLVIDPVLKYSSYFDAGADYPESSVGDASGNGYVIGFALPGTLLVATPGTYQPTLLGANAYVAKFGPSGELLFLTFLGGSGPDADGSGLIQIDSTGDVWVAGRTESTNFPVTSGAWQPICQASNGICFTDFLAELNPTGISLIYSTYTSPYYGDGFVSGIALDGSGNVYAAGNTNNPLFPTTPNAYQTCPYNSGSITGCDLSPFFFQLNPSLSGAASLNYSTFFIGAGTAEMSASGIAVDGAGMVYLTGTGGSITSNGWGFVAKFDLTADGVCTNNMPLSSGNGLCYLNYWPPNLAFPQALTFDPSGKLYVSGFVENSANDGIVTPDAYQTGFSGNGYYNAFVSRLDPATGNVLYGTLLGGSSSNAGAQADGVGADSAGNIYLVGSTNSAALFPLVTPVQSGIPSKSSSVMFVASFDPTLSTLRWSTFLGDPIWGSIPLGFGENPATSLGVDKNGNVFVAGTAESGVNLPTTAAAFQPAPAAGAATGATYGGFVARISTADTPGIALGPGVLTFPNTHVGSASAVQTVYIFAAGSQTLDITSITVSSNFKIVSNNCGTTLAGGASCQVTVAFKPASGGILRGDLTVVSNAEPNRDKATLSGVGVLVPIVAVSPKKLTFPATPIGTPSAPLAVTIYSTGSAPLLVSGITIGGTNYTDFSANNCPASIDPGQSCTVNVVMQPLVDGPLSASLIINTDAINGTVYPVLSGSGPNYTLSANPSSATVSAGASTASSITLTSEAGLTGKVKLGCSVPSGSGITCSFVPAKVTLAGSPANSTATILMSETTPSGSYKVIIYGSLTGLAVVWTPVEITVQ
jgi:hypothetical protein